MRVDIFKLATFYKRENECKVSCSNLAAYVRTVLEKQFYKFHSLFT